MRVRQLLLCLIVAGTTAACAGTPPMAMQGSPEDEAAIRGLAEKYMAAYNAGDAAALAALAAPDYDAVAPDGTRVTGPAAVERAQNAQMQQSASMNVHPTLSGTPTFVHWINADNAFMAGTFTVAGVPEGQPNKGAWLVTVKRGTDGQWQMTSELAANDMEPPAMANAPAMGK